MPRAERPEGDAETNFTYDGRSFLLDSRPVALELFFRDGFETGDFACWTGDPSCPDLPPVEPALFTEPLYGSEGRLEALHTRDDAQGPERRKYIFYLSARPVAILTADDDGAGNLSDEILTFVTTDHLGSPIQLSDDAGVELWEGGLAPFGSDYSDAGSDFDLFLRLPGQWTDATWASVTAGIDLYYNVHRWYEEGTGRYTRIDPVGITELDPHPYAYVVGNPLRFSDPLGLRRWPFGAGRYCQDKSCQCEPPVKVLGEDSTAFLPNPGPGVCVDADAVYSVKCVVKIPDNFTCTLKCDPAASAGEQGTLECRPKGLVLGAVGLLLGKKPECFTDPGRIPLGWPPNPF